LFPLFATGVIDTGAKFAAGALLIPVSFCHRYQQHQRNWWQNLPPVLLILVVHLDLQISPGILEKI
jgi:hypothetical protein